MSQSASPHDAQKILSDLRDHLARHDKPIAFFFGAGTSCAVRIASDNGSQPIIPAVSGLTKLCESRVGKLGERFAIAWKLIEMHCSSKGDAPHLENVLSRLRMMIRAIGGEDTLAGLSSNELQEMEREIRATIANAVTPDLSLIPYDSPHRQFARWLCKSSKKCPVEIFTVNYDVLFEHALELERMPIFDGFVGCYQPFFSAESLRRQEAAPAASWARLWKMHGSVTWRKIEYDERIRLVRGEPDPSGEMIYPSYDKYDESRQQPYSAFAERLFRFLEQDDALLVTAGFSFGDEHINNFIFNALENRPRTHVYALQFVEPNENEELVRRALQRANFLVIGPETGIIGGRRAPWSTMTMPDSTSNVFTVIPGEPEGEGARGVMRLGDFDAFARFLGQMDPE